MPERQQHRPAQRRQQKDGGGFGEHHQREEQANGGRSQPWAAQPGQTDGKVQGRQRERDQHWLQDGQTAEAVKEGAGDEQRQGRERHPARPARPEQQVAQQQIAEEKGDGQPARRLDRDSGKAEQHPFEEGPHRHRRRGVEVPGQVPVAEQVSANGGVAVPALIGVFGPVHEPRRVVGKIGAEMQRVQQGEAADEGQPKGVKPTFMGMRDRQNRFLHENRAL